MRRGRPSWVISASALVGAACLIAGAASPPPPPPPATAADLAANLARLSDACGDARTVEAAAEQIPVTVTALGPETLGFQSGKRGALAWKWGVRIASTDPRLHDLRGWDLDDTLGLIAVTGRRDWLTFDLQRAVLDKITAVGVSPMNGASAPPTSFSKVFGAFLVGYADAPTVDSYALGICGLKAKGRPLFDVPAGSATLVVGAASTYVGVVQPVGDTMRSSLELSYQRHPASLSGSDLPTFPGHHLVSLGNYAKIVPDLIALWASDTPGGEAVIQEVLVRAWDDHPPGATRAAEIGTLPRTPTAMMAIQPRGDAPNLLLAYDGPREGVIDVYAVSFISPLS